MSAGPASGYFESVKRLFSREVSLEEAVNLLEKEKDQELVRKLQKKEGECLTYDAERKNGSYHAYAVPCSVRQNGDFDLEQDAILIGEMEGREWDFSPGREYV